ncbi:Calcineurin-like phosphoesterase [Algibacter lectus]|uniref:metallophosphoesterase n=1 Tax=Algibacter lectus TaxID=221126 RepID=UPI0008E83AC9|nr:metallophosphoesterase [Algibacter lectus]SFC80627.1 Calcineurin-like phosphoesterase [Algibacter lectus]
MTKTLRYITLSLSVFFINACATYKTQINDLSDAKFPNKEIIYSFYLVGDAGNSPIGSESTGLKAFREEINKASEQSTVLFLGDNVYPRGLPKSGDKGREFAEYQLKIQTEAVKGFKGETIFIPGNHDWYSNGLKGLKRQEKYIEDALGKNTFLPEDGCPIEKVEISDEVEMIIIDTEWYLANWDKHPTINDDCEIKTRTRFFEELESLIKKARGKSTIIAMHHPMFTNGLHGGEYDFKSHMQPLPILGTLKNVLRETIGISPEDIQNKRYNELQKRVVTLAQENDKVILVSGHEHNLQYFEKYNLAQIVSGAGSKSTPTHNVVDAFSASVPGYARLDIFKDGSSFVRFYSAEENKVVFQTEVHGPDKKIDESAFEDSFIKTKKASIYSDEEVDKSGFHKAIWGDRYREFYGTKIEAPVVNLDTMFGGLTPSRKGGGHQSKSLQLKDKTGKRYVMRALRKSATVYLQAMAFKDQYIADEFDDTVTESVLLDFYTGSHPYAPFVTGTLSDAIDLFHTNPTIYYVPKQKALIGFNDDFGDELYMIEEHVSDGHGDVASFGFANKIESTDDLMKKLRKDEKYKVDEASYLRARLFDMVIGDWDRHRDQWRWAEFENKETGEVIYKPIPRDRDQAFSIMGDGGLMQVATRIIPSLKLMEGFTDDIRNIKGFNFSPYSLDMTFLNQTSKTQWEEQIKFIQNNLTEAVIDDAFTHFPKEVQGETVTEMKRVLLERIKNLPTFGIEYYKLLNECAVVTGTDKDDLFEIERLPNGETRLTASRIKNGEKGIVIFDKTYSKDDTKEIWIYGLDDEDEFHAFGEGDHLIKVRLIGGQNNDTYNIENGKKVVFYDYKSKKNTIKLNNGKDKLTDDYDTNVYDFARLKSSTNQFVPVIGANPDDGLKIGFLNTLTHYGFESNPFSSQHSIGASYYFATSGFDFEYTGEFSNVVGKWNLGVNAKFTSPNYAVNFFGYGNSTPNLNIDNEDAFGLDYNRVKYSTLSFAPSLNWRGKMGGHFKVSLSYEAIEVEESTDRFINTFYVENGADNHKQFAGVDALYTFQNKDNEAFPTMGMQTSLQAGYKTNIEASRGFGYLIPGLGFDYKLIPSGQLVLATQLKAHLIFGDDFEFYQAASLGGDNGLRGYRNERFSGKNAFYQSTDLRLNLTKLRTSLLPLHIGVYGGFDYGRVWIDDNLALDNNTAFNSNRWNTSVGGGVFANAANIMTLNLSAFNSNDGLRFAFKVGFGF